MTADCIFCAILAGDADASFVYRDKVASAFMDLQPVVPGHLLVVPFAGDGFALRLPDGYPKRPSRAELDSGAERIRARLQAD